MARRSSNSKNDNEQEERGVKGRSYRICDSILDAIGETPLVRLHRVTANLNCNVLVKCEYFNAGGSVKDRIGKRMIEDAEKSGLLKKGDTLIEPTSGNTGIGLALAAATKGYKCIITMPEKMSKEKVDVLKALGAEIVRTPTEAAYDAPDSHISVAKRIQQEIPNSHILDQYGNKSNPLAHYDGTAEEIIRQVSGSGEQIDMLVCGAGTGGTISGIAKRLKEYNPNIIVVGVDPEGSILAVPDALNDNNRLEPYHVEGIGYDFIPDVLDRTLVDKWFKSNDIESLVMMRKLIRDEGLLCGGSSGGAVSCCIKAIMDNPAINKKGKNVVVILPDSVRNYMTKALSDDWMVDHGFVDGDVIKPKQFQTWWAQKRVCDLLSANVGSNTPLTITSDVSCKDAIALLKEEGFDMVPVLHSDGSVIGVVSEGNMTNRLLSGAAAPDMTVETAGVIYKTFHKFTMNDTLADLAQALDHEPYALIVTEQRCFSGKSSGVSVDRKRKGSGGSERDVTCAGDDSITSDLNMEDSVGTSVATGATAGSQHLPYPKRRIVTSRCVVSGIVTRIDLLEFISSGTDDDLQNRGAVSGKKSSVSGGGGEPMNVS